MKTETHLIPVSTNTVLTSQKTHYISITKWSNVV